jgi:cell division transport system permease protein
MADLAQLTGLLTGDPRAARAVPPSGFTATLTILTSAAMAFLAVFALALATASGRVSDRWAQALTGTATVRISAPADQIDTQVRIVLAVLDTTPGVTSARALDDAETEALLEPWLGPDIPVDTLPIPKLVELRTDGEGFDAGGLRLRLQAEAPGAILDDHTRWREPLVAAADRVRLLGLFALALIATATVALVALAAQAALAANGQVIRVLRLVGARDSYIARAFVRRFTLRAFGGAIAGTALAAAGLAALPATGNEAGVLADLGFSGSDWLLPLAIPPLAAFVAFWATRLAAFRTLRGVT